ncbi:MAG: precorrin-6A reductase [Firmicutes bacterium]|nr:precorrin-6A reductase [Bacillota bacterium]
MFKICLFAGTTEGRELAGFLSEGPVLLTALTATEYGGSLIEPSPTVKVIPGRLDEEAMEELFREEAFDLVIDATHPYAALVTENIASACERTGTEYLRVLREDSARGEDCVFVSDAEEAARFLDTVPGNILLTAGSKEIAAFSGISGFKDRVWARVLPLESSLKACEEAGLSPSRIIAMQGPFSEKMNGATLSMCGASWLVTKESGKAGGFDEKLAAAKEAGAGVVVIGRPPQREGLSLSDTVKLLEERFGVKRRPLVTVAGVGGGSRESLTLEVMEAVREAGCLIGARRMLDIFARDGKPSFEAIVPEKIAELIESHPEYGSFAVLMSGDTGFYSGAKKLLPLLSGCRLRVLPGVSSLSLLCSRLGMSWEDMPAVSLHGRDCPVEALARKNRRVFVLTGRSRGVNELCERLIASGLENARLSVGERLSSDDEKLSEGSPAELVRKEFDSLSCVIIENPCPDSAVTYGLDDERFERGTSDGETVPMTKSEVRSVCLSKLRPSAGSVCWDVGSGTGSVAVELALLASKGRVYAVEKKPGAALLTEENARRFGVSNLTTVCGSAPEALEGLPDPDRVFIGGSSGNTREIIALALKKNPSARIVATAVTLETAAGLSAAMKEFPLESAEAVQLSVSKSRKAGPYNMMTAQNPVYVFTLQGKGEAR